MDMQDYNFLSDCLREILREKFKDIPLKVRNKIVREYDLEVLRYGYLRTDFTRTIVLLLCYASDGNIDWVKKELGKKILLQPNFEIDVSTLTKEQLNSILWVCISFIKKVGYFEDFKELLTEWDNYRASNPLLPFSTKFNYECKENE